LNNFIPPLILQPFVENAIWHGILSKEDEGIGKIHVEIKRKSAKLLSCIITDNGIGINESLRRKAGNNHISKGMNITQQRLGPANAMQVEEIDTGGTKVTLQIPFIYD
jgi:sensor histidine kinase YesM